jgi:hypothetical protein
VIYGIIYTRTEPHQSLEKTMKEYMTGVFKAAEVLLFQFAWCCLYFGAAVYAGLRLGVTFPEWVSYASYTALSFGGILATSIHLIRRQTGGERWHVVAGAVATIFAALGYVLMQSVGMVDGSLMSFVYGYITYIGTIQLLRVVYVICTK